MTEKKKKEEDISSETPRKKKPPKGGRLSDMIESMQKRGSPLNAHKVATRYFDSFRKERNIPDAAPETAPTDDIPPAPGKKPDTEQNTAVVSAVNTKAKRKVRDRETGPRQGDLSDLDESFTPSESRVYREMYKKSVEKKAPTLRFGLKDLKEMTGLSDKTVRVAIHSLEKKLSLRVVEPSLGVYGRKFYIPDPEEVLRERHKAGLEIDPTTKRVTAVTTAVPTAKKNAKDTAISNAVITTVTTAVDIVEGDSKKKMDELLAMYELYSGNERTKEDELHLERIAYMDAGVIEAAIILTVMKGKGGVAELSRVEEVIADFKEGIPEGYLEHLREAWKALRGAKS